MKYTCCLLFSLICTIGYSQKQYVELGHVQWLRNYDEAIEKSKSENKDIFLLFQEVPGCSTCKNYGKNVLQHPLIVEAIEDLFIPLAIFNNKSGHDEKILNKFKEPSWNNPVARVINSAGKNIVPRLSGQYNAYAVVQLIHDALLASDREIPGYLKLLIEELQADFLGTKETNISMFCFWSGEKNIGQLRGVSYTEAGFMDGHEVVKVRYSPSMIDYKDILKHAQSTKCAATVYTNDKTEQQTATKILGRGKSFDTKAYRKDKQDKYYLRHSDIQYIPLTDLQKTRINSMLGDRLDPSDLLSPRQVKLLQQLPKNSKKSLIGENIRTSWSYST